jgi:hypothetical protein
VISEGPALIEALSGALQSALNGALLPEEELRIAVRGGTREAFAATTQRLLVLKEPAISGTGPVEVREAPLTAVSNVRAQPRPVGGRLTWECSLPEAPTSIDYPTYDASKYSLVAGRLQQMIGQPRNPVVPSAAPATEPTGAGPAARPCPKCGTSVPADGAWCPQCGLQVSDPCWECGKPLAGGANFCAHCGTPNTEPAVIQCPQCKAVIGQGHACCTGCGAQARPVCQSCERLLRKEWSFCPTCGGEPGWAEVGTKAEVAHLRGDEPEDPSAWLKVPSPRRKDAEAANAAGIRAFEKEDYGEAARCFREATEADPENASYHTNLGVAYGELDDDMQAFAAYRRAVELNPAEVQAYLNMGYLYNERERTSEAREMWEKVVQLAPDSDEAQEARDNLRGLGGV